MSEVLKGKVRLYACGGGGINIGSRFEKHRGRDEVGFGQIEVVYIDTSRSNLNSRNVDPEACYLLDGMDGSGKVRAENYDEINKAVRDILQTHRPGDINIVLSTAAGGSGSVIAPLLASELLSRDIATIVIAVGNADTRLEAENTLKTLKSYEGVAKLRSAPVVMCYAQNDENNSRAQADAYVESVITALCALYSRENRELDSKDLFNWLHFDKVTSFQPQLAALTLVDEKSDISGLGHIISVATLAKDGDVTKFVSRPEYQCVGFLPAGAGEGLLDNTPLHFVTSDGLFQSVANGLNKLLREMDETRSARIVKGGLLGADDKPEESGLVL